MPTFEIIAKIWPSGDKLNLGKDSEDLFGPSIRYKTAAKSAPSEDGLHIYKFLFWNTGRHITSKRGVKWNFSALGFDLWTATMWYGKPGNGGEPSVRADAFLIGEDKVLGITPIDNKGSRYAKGAYPFNNDNHSIGTTNGPATVYAKDPYSSYPFGYDFAGWMQLIWGGDDSSEFPEFDTGPAQGDPGFYNHVTGQTGRSFDIAQGNSASLLAAYGNDHPIDIFIPNKPGYIPGPIKIADEAHIDYLRTRLETIERLLSQTQPGSSGETVFQHLIEAAPHMNREQLNQAVMSLKMTIELGETTLKTLTDIEKKLKS